MKNFAISLAAVAVLTSTSAHAFMVSNSEQCSAKNKQYNARIELSTLDKASNKLTLAAGVIDGMENEPAEFVVDITAGTVVKAAHTGVDSTKVVLNSMYQIGQFVAEAPECTSQANKMADGVDCLLVLPTKTVTISVKTVTDVGKFVAIGVGTIAGGVSNAVYELMDSTASYLKPRTMGEVTSVPFALIGLAAQGVNYVTDVVFYDTLGGAFSNLSEAVVTMSTDACDIFYSLSHLQMGQTLYHTLGLVVDTLAESANLVVHVVTLGKVSLRNTAELSSYPKSMEVEEGYDSYKKLMKEVN